MKTKISTTILALMSFVFMPLSVITADVDATIDTQLHQDLQQERIRTVAEEKEARIQPVSSDKIKFLLKSKMSGSRQLFWNEHMGSGQYRLRIQNSNANNKRAWFIFDSRTRTMRSSINRGLVVSNQYGQGFRVGRAAVVRAWRGEQQQRLHFYSGCKRNVRNDKGFCLDIVGGRNSNNQPVTFWKCHNGDNQSWVISQIKLVTVKDHETKDGKFPIRPGQKFMIRSAMSGHRMLYSNERFDSNRARRVRIRDFDAHVVTAYWVFDQRTNTIRSAHYRNWVLSNQRGYGFRIGRPAVVRAWTGEKSQPIKFYGGSRRNIRNYNGKCLDVYGGKNVHNQPVTWWNCHNGPNQGWRIMTIARKPTYRQPLRDGISFYIRSAMHTGKNLYEAEHIGGNQYRMRIRNFNIRQLRRNWRFAEKGWFTFDQRTRTIRSWTRRSFALSNQAGQGFNIGQAAVVRQWRSEVYQRIRVYGGNRRNIRNDGGKCLDVHGGHNHNGRHVIFWNCHNGPNQGWTLVRTSSLSVVVKYEEPPLRDGKLFQLRTQLNPRNRALFMDPRSSGNGQYPLRIRTHQPWCWRQWWTFDRRTKTIRQAHRRQYAISREYGTRRWVTGNAVARPFRNTVWQRTFYNRAKAVQDYGALVLTVSGWRSYENRQVVWWWTKNHAAQRWNIDTRNV
jgi:hypothetical protein